MRRVLVVLSVICFAGWSQPAQQQAQPPIVINNQMPREGFWIGFLKVALPTILAAALGSGITFYGLQLTNKHHATENEATRKHELEKLNRKHSFALKRDVLIRLTQLLVQTLAALKTWDNDKDNLAYMAANGECTEQKAEEENTHNWSNYLSRRDELEQATAAACLAVSDDLWKLAQAVGTSIYHTHGRVLMGRPTPFDRADEQIAAFTKAAGKELGIVLIDA